MSTDEYLDLPGEDKCMLEIRIRIKKMQNWVANSDLELTRDAVLQYMKAERQMNQFAAAQLTGGLADSPTDLPNVYQESQKDLLFDSNAAAYYERFDGFVPGGTALCLAGLKWPALRGDDRYTQVTIHETFLEVYTAVYGAKDQPLDGEKKFTK